MEAAQDGMFPCSGDEPFADNGPSEAAVAGALPRELQQDASAAARDALCVRYGSIRVRVSYAGECSIEEAVSRYLAASENVRDVIGEELPDAIRPASANAPSTLRFSPLPAQSC